MKHGIDVSKHQGDIDWSKVKESGVDFVILRVGYARTLDPKFYEYVEGCKANDIPIHGVYLFSYALNEEQAEQEATFAVNAIRQARLSDDTLIFFDLEYHSVEYAEKNGVELGKEECIKHTTAFCDKVIEFGYPTGVYFNLEYYNSMYDVETLDNYVKWLADWSGEADVECLYHQHTSTGSVEGIDGNVDLNYLYDPVEETEDGNLCDLYIQILDGEWGNGKERETNLVEAGHDYKEIQKEVNEIYIVAKEVVRGDWGNGEEREQKLTEAGYCYDAVQHRVNQLMSK